MKKYDFKTFSEIFNEKLSTEGIKELYNYFIDFESNSLFENEITLNDDAINGYKELSLKAYKNKFGANLKDDRRLITVYNDTVLYCTVF